jgi:hypothetical protein
MLLSSRALLAASVLALASGAAAQSAPAAATGTSDSALIGAAKDRIRGAVRATARASLGGGEIALLVAQQPPGSTTVGYVLLVFGADGLAPIGHDELDGLAAAAGAPTVALSTTAAPVAQGAFVATVGMKGADGSLRERMTLFRFGGGRLSRLHALPESRRPPPGGGLPAVGQEVEVLPTASGGFKDIRVRTRTSECGSAADCVERLEVASYTFDGVRYAPRPYAIPFVEKITGSTQLVERGGLLDHSAAAAVDGRPDTGWCEGAKGAGWFEKLELSLLPAQALKAVTIVPGSGEAFGERTRPKRIRVLLPDGRKVEADLADEPRAQRVALPPGDRVFGMTIVIVDVYKGKREDACIAELDLEVEP